MDREVRVEGDSFLDAVSFHDGPACPVDHREVLVAEQFSDPQSHADVIRCRRQYFGEVAAHNGFHSGNPPRHGSYCFRASTHVSTSTWSVVLNHPAWSRRRRTALSWDTSSFAATAYHALVSAKTRVNQQSFEGVAFRPKPSAKACAITSCL